MTRNRISAAISRLKEMLAGSVVLSAIGCLLCISGLMPVDSTQRDVMLALLPVIYIVWNVFVLRECYTIVRKKNSYYVINLCATAIFMFISVASYVFIPRKLYSWLFLVTYLGGFSNFEISGKISILMFFAVMIASVFLAVIKMEWVREKEEKRQREMANIPPVMEITPEVTPVWLGTEDKSNEGNETKEENSLS